MTKSRIVLALSLVFCAFFAVQVLAAGESLTPTKEKGKQAGEATTGVQVEKSGTPADPKGSKRAGKADVTVKPKSDKSTPSAPAKSLTPTKEKGKQAGEASTTAAPK